MIRTGIKEDILKLKPRLSFGSRREVVNNSIDAYPFQGRTGFCILYNMKARIRKLNAKSPRRYRKGKVYNMVFLLAILVGDVPLKGPKETPLFHTVREGAKKLETGQRV